MCSAPSYKLEAHLAQMIFQEPKTFLIGRDPGPLQQKVRGSRPGTPSPPPAHAAPSVRLPAEPSAQTAHSCHRHPGSKEQDSSSDRHRPWAKTKMLCVRSQSDRPLARPSASIGPAQATSRERHADRLRQRTSQRIAPAPAPSDSRHSCLPMRRYASGQCRSRPSKVVRGTSHVVILAGPRSHHSAPPGENSGRTPLHCGS